MNSAINVVAGIIFREDGQFLIARKKKGKSLAGLWEFPGGKIETGEDPVHSLQRELKEELGITVSDIRFLASNSFSYPEKEVILQCYTCKLQSGKITLIDHDAIEWVTSSEAMQYELAPADIPLLKLLNAEDPE